jgi:hypothetical protein
LGELLKGIMDANAKSRREEIKSGEAEMRSILNAWMRDIKDAQKEKAPSCHEANTE